MEKNVDSYMETTMQGLGLRAVLGGSLGLVSLLSKKGYLELIMGRLPKSKGSFKQGLGVEGLGVISHGYMGILKTKAPKNPGIHVGMQTGIMGYKLTHVKGCLNRTLSLYELEKPLVTLMIVC